MSLRSEEKTVSTPSNIPDNAVIVGFDDSPEATEAVRWAATVTARRGAELVVVAATDSEGIPLNPGEEYSTSAELAAIEQVAERGAEIARQTASITVHAVGVRSGAAKALKEASVAAQLLVVGHRGRGRLRSAMLGSIAYQVATHATCPVAVVRGNDNALPTSHTPIVVAVDGSEESAAAVTLAAQWAAEIGTPLRIVVAWRPPFAVSYIDTSGAPSRVDEAEDSAAAREAAALCRTAVAAASDGHPDLTVQTFVAPGRPAEVIVDAAADASVIVMGARGRSDFTSLLLGSVSREVMEQAQCPVYIVR